jgi:hypothetical protein
VHSLRFICFDKNLKEAAGLFASGELVRRVRLLLLVPPLRACTAHRCQVRQGKEARKGADRTSPRGLACAAPSHVTCALRLFQRPSGAGVGAR